MRGFENNVALQAIQRISCRRRQGKSFQPWSHWMLRLRPLASNLDLSLNVASLLSWASFSTSVTWLTVHFPWSCRLKETILVHQLTHCGHYKKIPVTLTLMYSVCVPALGFWILLCFFTPMRKDLLILLVKSKDFSLSHISKRAGLQHTLKSKKLHCTPSYFSAVWENF